MPTMMVVLLVTLVIIITVFLMIIAIGGGQPRRTIYRMADIVARRILGSQRALPHWLQATRTEIGRPGAFMG
jgi:hypothetical protein